MSAWRQTENGIYLPQELAGEWDRVARNRYVAHADMLGMSGLTVRDPKLAWSAVSEMAIARRRRIQSLAYTVNGRELKLTEHVAAITFSDTILLFTKGDDADDLRSILIACSDLFGLLLNRCIPIRIGLAHGLFVFNLDEGIFAGPPLIQAYRMGEEAQWMGAVLAPAVAERVRALDPSFLDGSGNDLVLQWDVPLKSGENASRWVLAWPRSYRNNFRVQPPISVEQFYGGFAQFFGQFENLEPTHRTKYENTVAFVNAMLDA